MKVHNLTIDSSQRDPVKYTNPNDYVITLESPIYDISQIKLTSARIPTPQLLVCESNRHVNFKATQGGITQDLSVSISVGNYTESDFAALFQSIGGYNFNISYDATENKFTMGQPTAPNGTNLQFLRFLFKTGQNGYDDSSSEHTTLHQIFGLPSQDIQMIGYQDFGAPNFDGPNSLVMRISAGSEQLNQTLPTSGQTPYYTGHILLPGGKQFVNVNGNDDKVTHDFHSGTLKSINKLRIQFFYMSHGRLIPYDFRNQDHVLKFELSCSTDKLENVPKVKIPTEEEEPIKEDGGKENYEIEESVNTLEDDVNRWDAMIYIFLIIMVGILFILPRRST